MTITKISDINADALAEYLHITDATQEDENTLTSLLGVATAYVTQYTGHSIAELDALTDVVVVILILVQDMWDNRTMYVDTSNANKVVESILNLHLVNFL